ncbi:MAG: 3-dehydroquinate synthase, partial [Chitinophagaceae bacterium]|nr:3-dehydroquinate synthase [Chitinophagaceae bacterium]
SHGQAISIGMTYASHISAHLKGFRDTERVVHLLEQYHLPTYAEFNKKKVINVLRMDKKRERKEMNYVLLEKTGKAIVESVSLQKLEKLIEAL